MLASLTSHNAATHGALKPAPSRNTHLFSSIAPLPSNMEAIKAGLLFAQGLVPFVSIVGPSGWGKTHLLDSMAAEIGSPSVRRIGLQQYLNQPQRHDSARPLILDDVQDVLGKTRCRQELRMQLERRVKAGRPTALAFTAVQANRQIMAFLPQSREWHMAQIASPATQERVLLVEHLARMEGVAVSSQLAQVMAHRLGGNGRTLAGALNRLRVAGNSWSSPDESLRACGVLDPMFADDGEWDLKLRILKAAKSRTRFLELDPLDLALHTMLCVADLAESEVARAADVTPAEAYGRAQQLTRRIARFADLRAYCHEFVQNVVDSLA